MTSQSTPLPAIRQAARHARLRWMGVGLFLAGALCLGAALAGLPSSYTSVGDVMFCMLATGLGLATFGSHNDTALALLRDNRWNDCTPESLGREIDGEVLHNRIELGQIEATPYTAWAMTFLAPLALAWAVSRLVL